jgi:DsbC/DsbD-like thiol-disulfide interchange protein
MTPRAPLLGCLATILCGGPAGAADAAEAAESPGVTVRLISEAAAIRADEPFRLGVAFELRDGWKIYWMNPGDAGLAPAAEWTLPDGGEAGAWAWPAPVRFEDGGAASFGYKEDVLFPLWARAADAPPEGVWRARVTVRWLACRETCIPGEARLDIRLPLAAAARPDPATAAAFRRADARLPRPLPSGSAPAARQTAAGIELRLRAPVAARAADPYFFPVEGDWMDAEASQRWAQTGGVWTGVLPTVAGRRLPDRISGVWRRGEQTWSFEVEVQNETQPETERSMP